MDGVCAEIVEGLREGVRVCVLVTGEGGEIVKDMWGGGRGTLCRYILPAGGNECCGKFTGLAGYCSPYGSH